MTWILQHLQYIHNHKRRKGRGRKGPWPLHTFWYSTFSYYISSTKGCLLSFERKKWNFNTFAHPTKILGFTWNILLFPPLVHNVWLIMDNWWTTVLWSDSTKLCNSEHFRWFTLKIFFGLHIKSLIDLKIFGATFGIDPEEIVLYWVTSSLPHAKRWTFNMHRSKEKWKKHIYMKENEDVYIAVV